MLPHILYQVCLAAVVTSNALIVNVSRAQFQAPYCIPCGSGWTSDLSWAFVSDGADDPMFAASSENQSYDGLTEAISGKYQHNINHSRSFFASSYVRGVAFYNTEFMTEPTWDTLQLWHVDGPASAIYSGYLNSPSTSTEDGWFEVPGSSSGLLRLQRTPATITFTSDLSVNSSGFRFSRVRVCCGDPTPLPAANVTYGVRNTGVLMAANDVVIFKVSPAPTSTRALHLTLWSSTSGVDFDIKARCNAVPTSTTFDYAAISSGRWEFLRIPYTATCAAGTWYVAVYSYAGGGGFNFVASRGQVSMEKTLRVGVEINATATQLDVIDETLRGGARIYYGMTEGQHLVKKFNLYNNRGQGCSSCGGQSCHICFEGDNDGEFPRVVNACQSGAKTYINFPSWDNPYTLAHELGHFLGCLPDEYCLDKDVPGNCAPFEGCQWCGHSTMGQHPFNLCQDANHNLNSVSPCITASPNSSSNWSMLANIEFIPLGTPDNFNYRNHKFSLGILVDRF